ncbi:hypothetical protein Golomagni_04480 [Golovinomyces magnicellulatus]|nr:hypothetical protein Golomagni_04480 [Golovinomyces magnicellulatus]
MKRNNVNEKITGSLDITVVENLTEANLNGMAYWFMQSYDEKSVFGPNLQWAFQDVFEGWEIDHFKRMNKNVAFQLKEHMRFNGVFLKQGRGYNPPKVFAGLVNEEQYHKWTDKEMIEQYESPQASFNSRLRFPSYPSLTTDVADVYQEPHLKPLTRSQKRAITFESNRNSSNPQNPLDNLSNIKQDRIDQRIQESSQYPQTGRPQYASNTKQELQGEWDNKEEDRQQQSKDHSTLASQFSREL